MKIGDQISITVFLSLFFSPFFSNASSLQVEGTFSISCIPSEREYTASNFPALDSCDNCYQWVWEVVGGVFENGKKTLVQKTKIPQPVIIKWTDSRKSEGLLTLILLEAGQYQSEGFEKLQIVSQTVHFGPPNPLEIIAEEGALSCEGNWFFVKTSTPLSGSEIIEWNIKNGLDANGGRLRYSKKSGEAANRLFVKRKDFTQSLDISVRIFSGCENGDKSSPQQDKRFLEPGLKLVGPSRIEVGNEVQYFTCSNPGNMENQWSAVNAIITGEEEDLVSVYFPKPGEGRVRLTIKDCSGEAQTATYYVKVLPSSRDNSNSTSIIPDVSELACRVYPNPAKGLLYVELPDEIQEGRVEFVTLSGKIILAKTIRENPVQIDTKRIAPGFYLLKITTCKGGAISRIALH
jgi:type IX secretion system substrate protein